MFATHRGCCCYRCLPRTGRLPAPLLVDVVFEFAKATVAADGLFVAAPPLGAACCFFNAELSTVDFHVGPVRVVDPTAVSQRFDEVGTHPCVDHYPIHTGVQLRDALRTPGRGQSFDVVVRHRWVRKAQLVQLRQDDSLYYPRPHGTHKYGCAVAVDFGDWHTDGRGPVALEEGVVFSADGAAAFPAWMAPYTTDVEEGRLSWTVFLGRELAFHKDVDRDMFLDPWFGVAQARVPCVTRRANSRRVAFLQQQVHIPPFPVVPAGRPGIHGGGGTGGRRAVRGPLLRAGGLPGPQGVRVQCADARECAERAAVPGPAQVWPMLVLRQARGPPVPTRPVPQGPPRRVPLGVPVAPPPPRPGPVVPAGGAHGVAPTGGWLLQIGPVKDLVPPLSVDHCQRGWPVRTVLFGACVCLWGRRAGGEEPTPACVWWAHPPPSDPCVDGSAWTAFSGGGQPSRRAPGQKRNAALWKAWRAGQHGRGSMDGAFLAPVRVFCCQHGRLSMDGAAPRRGVFGPSACVCVQVCFTACQCQRARGRLFRPRAARTTTSHARPVRGGPTHECGSRAGRLQVPARCGLLGSVGSAGMVSFIVFLRLAATDQV